MSRLKQRTPQKLEWVKALPPIYDRLGAPDEGTANNLRNRRNGGSDEKVAPTLSITDFAESKDRTDQGHRADGTPPALDINRLRNDTRQVKHDPLTLAVV